MKRIIIIGSRSRDTNQDMLLVEAALLKIYEEGDILVSGGCSKGGDRFAELLSKKYDIPMIIWKPKWEIDGVFRRWAGFERNTTIVNNGDVVIACVAIDRKGGTEDTINKFKKRMPSGEVILC